MVNVLKALGGGLLAGAKGFKNFLTGTPEKRENVSTLRPEQEGLYQQLTQAGQGRGAGGAFGEAADYYRDLVGGNSEDYDRFAAPALRQYNQDIVPGLSEQFAGMGAGGLGSSGFRNSQIQGATDLSERLGAMRANLRQRGAEGLANIGNLGLQSYSQNMTTQPGTQGFLSTVAPAIGTAAGTAIGGPIGGAIVNGASNWFGGGGNSSQGNNVGANSLYQSSGSNISASPRIPSSNLGPVGFQNPNWGKRGY